MSLPTLIIDFDSTLVQLEMLEELAKLALAQQPDADERLAKLRVITEQGMAGEITFAESLTRRLKLFQADRGHVVDTVSRLLAAVTPSVRQEWRFLREHADNIYVISGAFRDGILPVTRGLGLADDHVLANEFIYDDQGAIIGFEADNPLCQARGKCRQIEALNLPAPVWVIGDGYTDYEIKASGLAERSLAFTENVRRDQIVQLADVEITNLSELVELYTAGVRSPGPLVEDRVTS
jgi:D-3-phosphoglycerate dehydrogenase / 2-oxoglutarate reductase